MIATPTLARQDGQPEPYWPTEPFRGGSPGDRGTGGGPTGEPCERLPVAPLPVSRGANSHQRPDAKVPTIKLDWLRVSGPRSLARVVIEELDQLYGDHHKGRGGMFLGASFRWEDGPALFYDPSQEDDDGCKEHCVLDLPGSVLERITPRQQLCLMVRLWSMGFKGTRVDGAIDFISHLGVGLIDNILSACEDGHVVGARCWDKHEGYNADGLCNKGVTIGKRGKDGSGRYLRCYDKGLESGTHAAGIRERYEVEFTHNPAQQVFDAMCKLTVDTGVDSEGFAELVRRVMGSFDFRRNTDKNVTRRPRLTWWSELCDGINTIKTTDQRDQTTKDRWVAWWRSILPNIVAIAQAVDLGEDHVVRELCDFPGLGNAVERARAKSVLWDVVNDIRDEMRQDL